MPMKFFSIRYTRSKRKPICWVLWAKRTAHCTAFLNRKVKDVESRYRWAIQPMTVAELKEHFMTTYYEMEILCIAPNGQIQKSLKVEKKQKSS